MGDVIHSLPALTDAAKAIPNINVDWVVEEAFAEIPKWHANVNQVMPIAWRRFRKKPLSHWSIKGIKRFLSVLRSENYDYIIDAQGLIKSAVIASLARGTRFGLDRHSAWESIASFAYQKKIAVDPKQHAITRVRKLFSSALGYPYQDTTPEYGMVTRHLKQNHTNISAYLVFIHGTTWKTKEWPEKYWIELVKLAGIKGYRVLLPWGNASEYERAKRISLNFEHVEVLPACSLSEIASYLVAAEGIVSVDTGLGHLAAALSLPTVSLYGPTDPKEIGTMGARQGHIAATFNCAPCLNSYCRYGQSKHESAACFVSIPPSLVWDRLQKVIESC